MPEQVIFNIVFFSQIVLLSLVYPRMIVQRMTYVLETYPPSTHPRLYPKPLDHYESKRKTFRYLNAVILAIGLFILSQLILVPHETDVGNAVSLAYFMLQIMPLMWLDLSLRNELKLMRSLDTRTTRTAELDPRRLFDVLSPALVWSVVVVYVLFWVFTTYMRQFDYPWFGGYLNNIIITAANVFFAALIAWFMYGKKLNPHQSHADRMRTTQTIARILAFTSLALTVYAVISILLNAADARDLGPIFKSIYFQIIGITSYQAYRIDSMKFDVYREDQVAATSSSATL